MLPSPLTSLYCCLLLMLLLYLMLFVWFMQEFSEGLVVIFTKHARAKNIIQPVYLAVTVLTSAWFWISFAKTRQRRDSEVRVLGFLGITILVPHAVITLWRFSDLV